MDMFSLLPCLLSHALKKLALLSRPYSDSKPVQNGFPCSDRVVLVFNETGQISFFLYHVGSLHIKSITLSITL